MSDRPKTMRERTTLKVVAGKIIREGTGVSGAVGHEIDPSTVWTGTTLSTALENARAAGGALGDGAAQRGVTSGAAGGSRAASAEGVAQPEGAGNAVGPGGAAGVGHAEVAGNSKGAARVESGAHAGHAEGVAQAEGAGHVGHGEHAAHHEGPAKKIRAKPGSPSGATPSSPSGAKPSLPSGAKPSSSSSRAKHAFAATRSVARKLALQALYRWQLNDSPWQDLVQEFGEAEDMANADREYFRELVEGVWASRQSLDGTLAELMDRPVVQLDPVEHAVLLIGLFELTARPEVPYRVAINESVGLAKRFGATDGHKFVNAVLDRAARNLRPNES